MGHVDTRAFLHQALSQIFAPFAGILLSFSRMLMDYWVRIDTLKRLLVVQNYVTHILANL